MKKLNSYEAIKAQELIRNAINYNGTSCEFEIYVGDNDNGIITFLIKPKMKEFYIMFNTLDLKGIGEFLKATFISVISTNSFLYLTYMR